MVSASILLPGKATSRRVLIVVVGCSDRPLPYREPCAFSMCSHVFFACGMTQAGEVGALPHSGLLCAPWGEGGHMY